GDGDGVVVEHAGEAGRIAARAHIRALAWPGRRDDAKRGVGQEITAVWIKPVELLEQRKLHRRSVKPAQEAFVGDAIQIRGTVVHMPFRLQSCAEPKACTHNCLPRRLLSGEADIVATCRTVAKWPKALVVRSFDQHQSIGIRARSGSDSAKTLSDCSVLCR